jgi:hypothetical protein
MLENFAGALFGRRNPGVRHFWALSQERIKMYVPSLDHPPSNHPTISCSHRAEE